MKTVQDWARWLAALESHRPSLHELERMVSEIQQDALAHRDHAAIRKAAKRETEVQNIGYAAGFRAGVEAAAKVVDGFAFVYSTCDPVLIARKIREKAPDGAARTEEENK